MSRPCGGDLPRGPHCGAGHGSGRVRVQVLYSPCGHDGLVDHFRQDYTARSNQLWIIGRIYGDLNQRVLAMTMLMLTG